MSESASTTVNARPVLIDERDGRCEFCAAWEAMNAGRGSHSGKPRLCNRCKAPIAIFENMHGNGFQPPKPHHWHLRPVGPSAIPGREAVWEEVCLACYEASHREAYPTVPLPVRPRQIVEAQSPPPVAVGTVEVADVG